MDALTTMEFARLLTWVAIGLCGLFLSQSLGLLFWHGVVLRWLKRLAQRHLVRDQERVDRMLRAIDPPSRLVVRGRGWLLRNYLVKLCEIVDGDLRTRLVALYGQLGFTARDLRSLERGSFLHRMKALKRCRSMALVLPDAMWGRLLHHPNFHLRWAAMEYLIKVKGVRALIPLMGFIAEPTNARKGAILHLLACLAEVRPALMMPLLESCDQDFLLELLLRTLAAHPVEGAHALIARSVKATASTAILTAALDALRHYRDPSLLDHYQALAEHRDWRVRAAVATALSSYMEPVAFTLLERLCADGSYQVRQSAVQSLYAHAHGGAALQQLIADDRSHPAHYLLLEAFSQSTQRWRPRAEALLPALAGDA